MSYPYDRDQMVKAVGKQGVKAIEIQLLKMDVRSTLKKKYLDGISLERAIDETREQFNLPAGFRIDLTIKY